MTFQLGQEFESERLDGAKVTSIFTLKGNKLLEKQHGTGLVTVTAIWTFSRSVLTIESLAEEVMGTEVYIRS
jgi:hypothetical protein